MLLSVTLRDIKREYAVILSTVGALLLLSWGVLSLEPIVKNIEELLNLSQMPQEYAEIMLKALGISICTKLGSDICCDAGETAIGSKIEFCGKVCLLSLSIPLLSTLLQLAAEIVSA